MDVITDPDNVLAQYKAYKNWIKLKYVVYTEFKKIVDNLVFYNKLNGTI